MNRSSDMDHAIQLAIASAEGKKRDAEARDQQKRLGENRLNVALEPILRSMVRALEKAGVTSSGRGWELEYHFDGDEWGKHICIDEDANIVSTDLHFMLSSAGEVIASAGIKSGPATEILALFVANRIVS